MSSGHRHGPCHPLTMPSIDCTNHSHCHPFTISSIHHVIHSPCHPYTMLSFYHNIHSICHPLTMMVNAIHLPCNHSPCHPARIMVHAIHLPCHPFTISASHDVIQALSHYITPRWRDLRSFTRMSSSSCWRPPWRGRQHTGADPPLSLFSFPFPSCSHPPTLHHSTANTHLPYSWSS